MKKALDLVHRKHARLSKLTCIRPSKVAYRKGVPPFDVARLIGFLFGRTIRERRTARGGAPFRREGSISRPAPKQRGEYGPSFSPDARKRIFPRDGRILGGGLAALPEDAAAREDNHLVAFAVSGPAAREPRVPFYRVENWR